MPLNTPDNVDEVIDRVINDVFLSLNEFGAKPSLSNSWLNSLIVAYSNRVFDFYFALDQAALECLPDTAQDNLERWGSIYKVQPTPGNVASGAVVVRGEAGSVVQAEAVLASGDGFEYNVTEDVTITSKSGVPLALIQSDGLGTATVTWIFNANAITTPLADGDLVTITGATEPEYNVAAAPVTVLSPTSWSYQIEGTPSTPATGSPVGAWTNGLASVESTAFSEEANAEPFAGLQFESPIVGVNTDAVVYGLGLTGGADLETPEAFRTRLLDRIQNPVAHFNVADIDQQARTVPGVTRVFVFEITPAVGQVTVYFMRDNDDTGAIPDGAEIQDVKDALDLIRPANTAPEDLIVLAPEALPIDFVFTALNPNTASMKTAIIDNLTQFFKEGTSVGENVPQDAYRSVIFNTVDTTNGQRIESFTLSAPTGDILVSAGQIATLGNVNI